VQRKSGLFPGGIAAADIEKAMYVAIVILVIATRLWGLGDRVQSHDESIHTKYSWNLYSGLGFEHHPLMHGPFLFHATALSYFLMGDNDFSARVPVALLGVGLVLMPYFFRRWLGRAGAVTTSFFLLISPSIWYYSRYIRHDIPVMVWAFAVVLAIFSYLRSGQTTWLYVLAAGVSLMFATKEVAFIYAAVFGLFTVALSFIDVMGAEWTRPALKPVFAVAIVGATAGVASVLAFAIWGDGLAQVVTRWWLVLGAGLLVSSTIGGGVAVILGLGGIARSFRSLDLAVVLGTLCLPFLSPALIKLMGFDPMDYSAPTLYYSGAVVSGMVLLSVAVGLLWNPRSWAVAASVHYSIFVVLFTTLFTNGYGFASGLIGSLGYWLAQQAVERGSQPQYYYLLMVAFYEFLPVFLSAWCLLFLAFKRLSAGKPAILHEETLDPLAAPDRQVLDWRFAGFLVWWTFGSWLGYSLAGERMPWLTVHLAFPMILLSGLVVGKLLESIDWRSALAKKTILLVILVPGLLIASVTVFETAGMRPFQGLELGQLRVTGRFLSALVGVAVLGGAAAYVLRFSAWWQAARLVLLAVVLVPTLLTVRASWRLCYVNYDYPTEFLVYAHAGPSVRFVMDRIEQLSRRITGTPNLMKVAYGADASTLFFWQLRDFPNAVYYGEQPSREQMDAPVIIAGRDQWGVVEPYLGDNYTSATYTYLWWPMEDYRNLTWERIRQALTQSDKRAALWDIWYDRDYTRYDDATGKNHTLDAWPLRSEFRMYLRRDIPSAVWELGSADLGEAGYAGEAVREEPDPYAEGWVALSARLVFGTEGDAPGQLRNPRGVAVGADGSIYVADAGNHRVQKFSPDGKLEAVWGSWSSVDEETGLPAGFNEPWGIAVGSDADVYVADTWNHRIQRFEDDGELVATWGTFGQHNTWDPGGDGVFYGPRGVALDALGNVYVTDTGNKRVQVFAEDGEFLLQWGGGGSLEGYLDEPVGIAVGPEGQVFVADTWNRRIQVFASDGAFLRQWDVSAWESYDVEEKPYIAVDHEGRVYITDPGNYRIIVFDSDGEYLLSFGQFGFDELSLAYPGGIAVDPEGAIYVSDAHSGRVLVFSPILGNGGSK
jgi:DNA-binding beta-propeller fold protein YncE